MTGFILSLKLLQGADSSGFEDFFTFQATNRLTNWQKEKTWTFWRFFCATRVIRESLMKVHGGYVHYTMKILWMGDDAEAPEMAFSAFYDSFALDCFSLGVVSCLGGEQVWLFFAIWVVEVCWSCKLCFWKKSIPFNSVGFWKISIQLSVSWLSWNASTHDVLTTLCSPFELRFYLVLLLGFTHGYRQYRDDANASILGEVAVLRCRMRCWCWEKYRNLTKRS